MVVLVGYSVRHGRGDVVRGRWLEAAVGTGCFAREGSEGVGRLAKCHLAHATTKWNIYFGPVALGLGVFGCLPIIGP